MQCPWCQAECVVPGGTCPSCGRARLEKGAVVSGRYEVLDTLGRGGMGVVFRAHDRVLEEAVALKVMSGSGAPEELALPLRLEIKLARRVSHENVCRIHEYGEHEGLRYISMELVDGIDLKRRLAADSLSTREAFDVALQALAGLAAIHKAGIIHRDLKSANLMIDRGGLVKVMDFGIAKAAGGGAPALTRAGEIVGSPEYMSPEQARGEVLDARSDIYSMGVVLFELFSGHVPFHGGSPLSTVLKQLSDPPPLDGPVAARMPPAILPVLRAALAKVPGERFSTVVHLADAVRLARATAEAEQAMATATVATPTPLPAATPGPSPAAAPVVRLQTSEADRPAANAFSKAAFGLAGGGLAALALAGLVAWLVRPVSSPEYPARATPLVEPPRATSPPPSASVPAKASAAPSPARGASAASAPPAAPRRVAPRPSAAADQPATVLAEPVESAAPAPIPIGTDLVVNVTSEIRSDRARPGSWFTAVLAEPLVFEGHERVAAGAALAGRVVRAGAPAEASGLPFLELNLSQIEIGGETVPIRTGLYRVTPPSRVGGGPGLRAVVVGAAVGLLAGAAAGGRGGAAMGAGAGAAVGAGLSASTSPPQEYRFGSRLTFRLAEPLAVSP